MKNKITTIVGFLILFVATGAYLLFDFNIKQNSNAMGVNVLIAKTNVREGTVIKSTKEANELFGIKRIVQSEAVPSVVKVSGIKSSGGSLFSKFSKNENYELTQEDLMNLVNKKITTNIYKNEQVLGIDLSTDTTEFKDGDRYFAIPTTFEDCVGAEVSKGDYVDAWMYPTGQNAVSPEKVIGPLKVIKIKDANNQEVSEKNPTVPKVVIVKVSEDQIKIIKEKMMQGTIFLTKLGVTPSR